MPAWFMMVPARMNSGTASSGKESVAATKRWTKMSIGGPAPWRKNTSVAMAIASATGTLRAKRTSITISGTRFKTGLPAGR